MMGKPNHLSMGIGFFFWVPFLGGNPNKEEDRLIEMLEEGLGR